MHSLFVLKLLSKSFNKLTSDIGRFYVIDKYLSFISASIH